MSQAVRRTVVVKAGGDIAANESSFRSVVADIAQLRRAGIQVLVVHGGGPQLDAALKKQGRKSRRVAGRRVTSQADLELAIQVWRGSLSAQWVGALHAYGVRAVGLCGADGGVLQAHKRPPVRMADDHGDVIDVDFGFVGDLDSVNTDVLHALLDAGMTPVVSPLAMNALGALLNVNADTVAAAVAGALQAECLAMLSAIPGVLADIDDPSSRIGCIALDEIPHLIEKGVLKGGMLPKVAAIEKAIGSGLSSAYILDGRRRACISDAILRQSPIGTQFTCRSALAIHDFA